MIKHGFYNQRINLLLILLLLVLSCKKKKDSFEYDVLNDLHQLNLEYLNKCCNSTNFKNPIKVYLSSPYLEKVRRASIDFVSKNQQELRDKIYLLEYLRDDNPKIVSYLILNEKKIVKFEYDINQDTVEYFEVKDEEVIREIATTDWAAKLKAVNCCIKTIPHLTVTVYSRLNHKAPSLFVENTVLKMD